MTRSSPTALSRRAFGRRALGIARAMAASCGDCLSAAGGRRGGRVHRCPRASDPGLASRPMLSVEGLLGWMDKNRVAQAVVLPWCHRKLVLYDRCDWVLQQTLPHRDRLIPFCDIDPRTVYLKPGDMAPVLARYVARGQGVASTSAARRSTTRAI